MRRALTYYDSRGFHLPPNLVKLTRLNTLQCEQKKRSAMLFGKVLIACNVESFRSFTPPDLTKLVPRLAMLVNWRQLFTIFPGSLSTLRWMLSQLPFTDKFNFLFHNRCFFPRRSNPNIDSNCNLKSVNDVSITL